MAQRSTETSLTNGNNKTKNPYSDKGSQLFFNQKQISPSSEIQETPKTQEVKQPTKEISLQTTTDILLAAILQELKTQNMLELMKLKAQQEQEQEELQAAEEMKKRDNDRFEEIRLSMYS